MNVGNAEQEVVNGRVVALFAGGRSTVGDGGHQSGIRKHRVLNPIELTRLGLVGDEIVDRRFHGGPDKAINMFPQEHYPVIRALFPGPDEPFEAGGFGENISSEGLSDDAVRIGDTYEVGSAVIQISQPRSPCWKLSARFGIDKLAPVVHEKRLTGWYARVLQVGVIQAGDEMRLISRDVQACTISAFWDFVQANQPDPERLAELANITSLALDWRKRLEQRALWLRKNR